MGESALELVNITSRLFRRLNLRRAIFEFLAVFGFVLLALLGIKNLSSYPATESVAVGIAALIGGLHTFFQIAHGGYSASWRFFSFQDGKAASLSAVSAVICAGTILYSALPMTGWVIVLYAAIAGVIGPRLFARVKHSQDRLSWVIRHRDDTKTDVAASNGPAKLLMIGFGDHVVDFIRSQSKADSDYEIIGVVHIKPECEAASIRGVPIVGSIDKLGPILRHFALNERRPDYLVLTRDEMSTRSAGEILTATDKFDIPVAWLPRADRINPNPGEQLRPVKLDDLLPRSTNLFDAQACGESISGSTVLVTGAGGSIGSELARQIGNLTPGSLILTDASEHALYMIDQEIRRIFPTLKTVSKLLDVRDRDSVFRAMETHRPEYVFHAAALKHVPIVEAQACEGILTNVVGSQNVADAAASVKVVSMVMVSTDKAVNPANVMGATKRLAEAYCQAMDAAFSEVKGATRYVTVRFGNVLGSNGSVVPLFQKQLERGGPLTVTHPDIERYFMTIPEASRLILEALLRGADDHDDDRGIFVLDMGQPVKIVDLAKQVIRLSDLTPERDIRIVYSGLRPGEKLYEELVHQTEDVVPTDHPSLTVARPRFVQIQTIRSQIDLLQKEARSGDSDAALRLLKVYVPEFERTARAANEIIEKDNLVSRSLG